MGRERGPNAAGPEGAIAWRMAVIDQILSRAGYVKLSDYGLALSPEGRIVTQHAPVPSEGFGGGHVVGWRPFDPPGATPTAPIAAAPRFAVPAGLPPLAAAATRAPAVLVESEDEEEWEWQLALARARAAAETEAPRASAPKAAVAAPQLAPRIAPRAPVAAVAKPVAAVSKPAAVIVAPKPAAVIAAPRPAAVIAAPKPAAVIVAPRPPAPPARVTVARSVVPPPARPPVRRAPTPPLARSLVPPFVRAPIASPAAVRRVEAAPLPPPPIVTPRAPVLPAAVAAAEARRFPRGTGPVRKDALPSLRASLDVGDDTSEITTDITDLGVGDVTHVDRVSVPTAPIVFARPPSPLPRIAARR